MAVTRLAALLVGLATAASLVSPDRCGLLVVGLAGNNGVTLLGGQVANQRSLSWESSKERRSANCLGCITQVGALSREFAFARFDTELAVGGWDVVPTPLGDALYQSRILDYDLVRQVRDEMNGMAVMPGVWDPDFYGETQHAGATHVVPETTRLAQLAHLREDIRRFKADKQLNEGHVTVVWSASVERPCTEYERASELFEAIERDDKENVSPSLIYAVASLLEGCSFVNGGSQNTIQPALVELSEASGLTLGGAFEPTAAGAAYALGTDFKAGQTKAKTAIVEYLRALGLQPRTIASYNHLGNNDMKNLLSPRTWKAKARVKTDVFGPWQSDGADPSKGEIDHKVAVLYTEQMGDEKRDTVEYTSDAFMGCEHTMLTYTRCMDSALCVPLMIDVAIFCDYLRARGATSSEAAKALAYLFKLNEGAAIGVDPGFFHQTGELRSLLEHLPDAPLPVMAASPSKPAAGPSSAARGCLEGSVLCAGLSCVDMQLLRAATPSSPEAIAPFHGTQLAAGGSASNTASALRALGVDAAVLTCTGRDVHGDELARIYASEGIDTSLLLVDESVSTSLAVLPVFEEGGRGCWVDLSANDRLTPARMLEALQAPAAASIRQSARAVHLGYPHLMSGMRGEALRSLLSDAAELLTSPAAEESGRTSERGPAAEPHGGPPLLSLDVNGATLGAFADADGTVGPALPLVDMLHANLEEAAHIVGAEAIELAELTAAAAAANESGAGLVAHLPQLRALVAPLLAKGVAVAAITLGGAGAFVAVTEDATRLARGGGVLSRAACGWRGQDVLMPALPLDGELNANGAGDAFTAGLLTAMLWRGRGAQGEEEEPLELGQAVRLGLESARQRVDSARREQPETVDELVEELQCA